MDYCKLFCDVLPAWLSGLAAVVAIVITCISNSRSNRLQAKIAADNSKLLKDIQRRDANMKLYDLRLGGLWIYGIKIKDQNLVLFSFIILQIVVDKVYNNNLFVLIILDEFLFLKLHHVVIL